MDNNFKPINMPQFDLSKFNLNSPAYDMAQQISRSMEERNRQIQRGAEEIYERQEAVRQAAIRTAENTEEMKGDLQKVVHNQNNYIYLLEQMVENQKQQIANQDAQLKSSEEILLKLKEILEFSELSADLQDEIADMICDEITGKHPGLEYIADKGGDVATAGIVAMLPHVFNGLKLYLMSKGIL